MVLKPYVPTQERDKTWITSLDGIRAIAALLVLACHSALINVIYGTAAVWLFFVLSAFLLTRPFLKREVSFSVGSIAAFYIRRIFRIMPMYAFFVVAFGLILRGVPYITDNLFFFQGNDHLWTINQEMAFYLIMPAFIAVLLLFRRYPSLCAAALVVTGAASDKYHLMLQWLEMPFLVTYFLGTFFVSLFLLGMAAAAVVPTVSHLTQRLEPGPVISVISLAVFAIAVAPHIYAAHAFTQTKILLENEEPLLMGLTFVPLLIWISVCPDNWLTKFLSIKPLRIVGKAAFSFYLIHNAVLDAFNGAIPGGWRAFACAALVTGICSIVTFNLVERPGIRIGNLIIDYFEARGKHRGASITMTCP
jgi:peptidoglycan/LPS O-acetylase OafA/YrhL